MHFGERGVCFRERGLYPRLNQSEDERSQTRSGNESTCCASRAWMDQSERTAPRLLYVPKEWACHLLTIASLPEP